MKMNQTKQIRILAISLSSRGFGYAVMEDGNTMVDYGNVEIKKNKNARALAHVEKIIDRSLPDILVLRNVSAKGTRRGKRIKELDRKIITVTKGRKLNVVKISGKELRRRLLEDENGTKHQMAGLLAKQYPDELAWRLPPKRRAWDSEDHRMDIFDAVGLAVAYTKRP